MQPYFQMRKMCGYEVDPSKNKQTGNLTVLASDVTHVICVVYSHKQI